MVDTYVYLIDLPDGVRGCTVPGANNDFTIYIDKRLSDEQQLKTYQHELRHILEGDFEKADVVEIEAGTHKKEE